MRLNGGWFGFAFRIVGASQGLRDAFQNRHQFRCLGIAQIDDLCAVATLQGGVKVCDQRARSQPLCAIP